MEYTRVTVQLIGDRFLYTAYGVQTVDARFLFS